MYYESNYLEHHGIKGQRWGVRRYQNYDGSYTKAGLARYQKKMNKTADRAKNRSDFITKDHTVPAGTKMYRSTMSTGAAIGKGPTYASYTETDRNTYRGGWVRNTKKDGDGNHVIEHEYELTQDLKIPSRNRVKQAVAKAMEDSEVREDAIRGFANIFVKNYGLSHSQGIGKEIADSIVETFGDKSVDEQFVDVSLSLGVASKMKQSIINDLSKEGYNAMTDEASVLGNAGWAPEGYDPLIIFKADESLKETSTTKITAKEEQLYVNQAIKWRNKHRRYMNKGVW